MILAPAAKAELPLNVHNEWRGVRAKMARVLTPELRVAAVDPVAAELRLTRVILKLVRMDVTIEKVDAESNDEILKFIVHGELSDALDRVRPDTALARDNVARYVAALAAQADFDSYRMDATIKRAVRRQNLKAYAQGVLAFVGLFPFDYVLTQVGFYTLPGSSLPLFALLATSVALPIVKRPVPFFHDYPSSHLGDQFERCEYLLADHSGNLRDITPPSSKSIRLR